MQEVSVVQRYRDVGLNDNTHKKAAISRLLTASEVKNAVGKLKRVKSTKSVGRGLAERENCNHASSETRTKITTATRVRVCSEPFLVT